MLTLRLCEVLREKYSMVVITNDIYTQEDAQFLAHNHALPEDRIMGVETGGCPHTAIRDDTSMNAVAIEQLVLRHPDAKLVLIESGGDNLSATFSPELVDAFIYVIDVAEGDKIDECIHDNIDECIHEFGRKCGCIHLCYRCCRGG